METLVDYGARLGWAMSEASVTAADLGRALGISRQAIAKVLDGTSKALNAYNNAVAAKFLRVSPDWLATGEGDAAPYPEDVALEVARRFEALSAAGQNRLLRLLRELEE